MEVKGSAKSAYVWLACVARLHSHYRQLQLKNYNHQCLPAVFGCGGIGGSCPKALFGGATGLELDAQVVRV